MNVSPTIKAAGRAFLDFMLLPIGLIAVSAGLVGTKIFRKKNISSPRLLWGAAPIKTLKYTSEALKQAGYLSETVVIELYPRLTTREDFDNTPFINGPADQPFNYIANTILAYVFFAKALTRYDIFHYFFDGGILQRTPLGLLEPLVLRMVGKKVVFMPYGSDSFVYDQIPQSWRLALSINYPIHASKSAQIQRRLRWFTLHSDCVVGCLVHLINLPRVDVLPLTWYPVDTPVIAPVYPSVNSTIKIAHAPNHRGAKGTEFVIEAVSQLRHEGADVELLLIEGKSHAEALDLIRSCDIFIDQLIFGYALAAMEAMAYGKVVISGIEADGPEYLPFKRYSYLDECPVIPASPETIYDCLKTLVNQPNDLVKLGHEMRTFAEKRHSPDACVELFESIYQSIWHHKQNDLLRLYRHQAGSKKV